MVHPFNTADTASRELVEKRRFDRTKRRFEA